LEQLLNLPPAFGGHRGWWIVNREW
jgi:hypothetical protein